MAYEAGQPLKSGHLVAAADLTAYQYHFVKIDANGRIAAVTAGTDKAFGVLQNKPTIDSPCELVHIGFTKVKAGMALTTATAIGVDATGKASTAPTLKPALTLEAASALDVITTALVNCVMAF